MPLPAPLSRRRTHVHKYHFGHVLVLAGSRRMLGAAALAALSAYRSGAGLVTAGVPQTLNSALQKKLSPEVMTWPLPATEKESFSSRAFAQLRKDISRYQAVALGPGLSRHPSTAKFALKVIAQLECPVVVDADALHALSGNLPELLKSRGPRILTPHVGEFCRLTGKTKAEVDSTRKELAVFFAKTYGCVLLLKGHRTLIANAQGQCETNRTGNAGMATAGSGDVLTGMIAAFLAQGMPPFDAALGAAFFHGKAGDLAARRYTPTALIASDIIFAIPTAFKRRSLR